MPLFGYYGLAVTERHYYVFKEHSLAFIWYVPVSPIKKQWEMSQDITSVTGKQVVYEMAKSSEKRSKYVLIFTGCLPKRLSRGLNWLGMMCFWLLPVLHTLETIQHCYFAPFSLPPASCTIFPAICLPSHLLVSPLHLLSFSDPLSPRSFWKYTSSHIACRSIWQVPCPHFPCPRTADFFSIFRS